MPKLISKVMFLGSKWRHGRPRFDLSSDFWRFGAMPKNHHFWTPFRWTKKSKKNKNSISVLTLNWNSPGHRPVACQILHQLLFCSSVVFFFTSPRARGGLWDPPGQKYTLRRSPAATKSTLWRSKARFFGPLGRRPKMMIFWHRSKTSKIIR